MPKSSSSSSQSSSRPRPRARIRVHNDKRTPIPREPYPIGIIIGIPLLVLITGICLAWVGHLRLEQLARNSAVARLNDAAISMNRSSRNMVADADPVLTRWRDGALRLWHHQRREDWEAVMGDLIVGQSAITQISITLPSGSFRSMRKDPTLGPVMYEAHLQKPDLFEIWSFTKDGIPTLQHQDHQHTVDYLSSAAYRAAVAARSRAWDSELVNSYPYIIRSEPLFHTDDTIAAIVAIEINLDRLIARVKDSAQNLGAEVLLTDLDGAHLIDTHLPDSADEQRITRRNALIKQTINSPNNFHIGALDGVDVIVLTRKLTAAPGLFFHLVLIEPLAPLLAESWGHLRFGMFLTAGIIILAFIVALLYANELRRTRQTISKVRQEADELGSYILEEQIGSGGMGEVWRARHQRLACPAALKLIRHKSDNDANAAVIKRRFIQEAQVMSRLTSAHIVRVFDFGELADGTLYYAMELLVGLDCEQLMERRHHLSPGAVVHILLQACDALSEAHSHNLIHRDLKPANLFICLSGARRNLVKILDFGLVQGPLHHPDRLSAGISASAPASTSPTSTSFDPPTAARPTRDGFIIGTPGFCSPEQLCDETVDGRSDLYSLGCIAYYFLTGRNVFVSATMEEELLRHVREDAPRLGAPIPPEFAAIVHQLLARKPADRPATAAALREALLACDVEPDPTAIQLYDDDMPTATTTTVSDVSVYPKTVKPG